MGSNDYRRTTVGDGITRYEWDSRQWSPWAVGRRFVDGARAETVFETGTQDGRAYALTVRETA